MAKRVIKVKPKPILRTVRPRNGAPACLWPIGDPGEADFHFCGAETVPSKPYCPEHCARAYVAWTRVALVEAPEDPAAAILTAQRPDAEAQAAADGAAAKQTAERTDGKTPGEAGGVLPTPGAAAQLIKASATTASPSDAVSREAAQPTQPMSRPLAKPTAPAAGALKVPANEHGASAPDPRAEQSGTQAPSSGDSSVVKIRPVAESRRKSKLMFKPDPKPAPKPAPKLEAEPAPKGAATTQAAPPPKAEGEATPTLDPTPAMTPQSRPSKRRSNGFFAWMARAWKCRRRGTFREG